MEKSDARPGYYTQKNFPLPKTEKIRYPIKILNLSKFNSTEVQEGKLQPNKLNYIMKP